LKVTSEVSENTSVLPSGELTDIEHVLILTQENRSSDHYFGSYPGVCGFSDQSAAFQQTDPANTTTSPVGQLLPFHLDTSQANAACTHDISHDWVPQDQSWDNGKMDGFMSSRLSIDSNDALKALSTCWQKEGQTQSGSSRKELQN
jgi:phospholipase C